MTQRKTHKVKPMPCLTVEGDRYVVRAPTGAPLSDRQHGVCYYPVGLAGLGLKHGGAEGLAQAAETVKTSKV